MLGNICGYSPSEILGTFVSLISSKLKTKIKDQNETQTLPFFGFCALQEFQGFYLCIIQYFIADGKRLLVVPKLRFQIIELVYCLHCKKGQPGINSLSSLILLRNVCRLKIKLNPLLEKATPTPQNVYSRMNKSTGIPRVEILVQATLACETHFRQSIFLQYVINTSSFQNNVDIEDRSLSICAVFGAAT